MTLCVYLWPADLGPTIFKAKFSIHAARDISCGVYRPQLDKMKGLHKKITAV